MQKRELYIGADDSNHGDVNGLNTRNKPNAAKMEIIVATFSLDPQDGKNQFYKHIRQLLPLENWLALPGRDYRFTVIPHGKSGGMSNIPTALPHLVSSYLADKQDIRWYEMHTHIDGRIQENLFEELQDELLENRVDWVSVKDHPKNSKRRVVKKRSAKCPPVIYMADNLANRLFNGFFGGLATHPKFVELPF